jgi:hypothetical protein
MERNMKSHKSRELLPILLPLILFLFVSSDSTFGQTTDKRSGGRGGFDAPIVKYTVFRDQGAVMFQIIG